MRANASVSILLAWSLAGLLSACASAPELRPSTVSRVGSLQVHPGLINPQAQAFQERTEPPAALPVAAPQVAALAIRQPTPRMDTAKLRKQRSIYFDYKDSEIKDEFVAVLEAHARYLARHPEARVRLEGHADGRASPSYNLRLALQRADAVKRALLEHGAQKEQIRVVSLGEIKPMAAGDGEEAWALNRRTDIVYDQED